MTNPTIEEKDAEIQAVYMYADHIEGTVTHVQGYEDDGGPDGIIQSGDDETYVEVRRKGFENHSGRACKFRDGWDDSNLRSKGIYLNESTIRKYDGVRPFVYLVEIKGGGWRAATIDQKRIDILLRQQHFTQKSTNSNTPQSVKKVQWDWFEDRINCDKVC